MKYGYFNIFNDSVYTMDGYIDLTVLDVDSSIEVPSESSSSDFLDDSVDVPINVPSESVLPDISEEFTESGTETIPNNETSVEENTDNIIDENSVSSNEIQIGGGTVSVDNAVDYSSILVEMSSDIKLLTVEEPKFFDKKLDDFTVTEGLLLLCFVMLLVGVFAKIIKGGEKHV